MPWSIADTQYDDTHPWDSLFNSVPLNDVLKCAGIYSIN